MKYLKKFSTESEYQTFKNGDDWVTPNVSAIEEDNGLFYNEIPKLISFTVYCGGDGFTKEYTAEEGMTWEEWINSGKYDTSNRLGSIAIRYNAPLNTGGTINAVNCAGANYSFYYDLSKPAGGTCAENDIIENGATYTARGER